MLALRYGISELLGKLLGPRGTLHGARKLARDIGQVTRPIGGGRHRNISCADADNLPRALIVAENKKLVAHDGAADRAAKLILDEFSYGWTIEITGVQIGIP